jgi:hypothetical protein
MNDKRHDETEVKRSGGLVAGLALIAVGTVFLLDQLEVVEMEDLWHHWPWLLIVIGVVKLTRGRDWSSRRGGVSLLIVGSWLLLNVHGLFDLTWHDSWPLLLIAFGLLWAAEGIVRPDCRPRREVGDGR